ncbi:MAG: cupin domain-containing protein [Leptothrix sp. (in: b-proteobacteria)]
MSTDSNSKPLPTHPPMSVGDVLDKADGVYFCVKNHDSVFLWVNQNFADLVGQSKEALIGSADSRAAHVAHDKAVMASGKPLLDFHETIDVPTAGGSTTALEIVTQKGLLRKKGGHEIIGITVCFSRRFPAADQEADDLIRKLKLVPTSVGGHFTSGPGSTDQVLSAALPERFVGDRRHYSTNYYLLRQGELLRLHALHQDEQWFYHRGSAVRLHIFSPEGVYSSIDIGADLDQGQVLQAAAPHDHWFGAELLGPGYVLVSCSLAPGYDPRDSVNPTTGQLAALKQACPTQAELIQRLAPA